jgi:Pyridoxamine 5''-phosphate oxidase.
MTKVHLAAAEGLVRLLMARDEAAQGLLSEDIVYRTLGLELNGRAQVLAHLTGEETGRFYRQAEWSEARLHGDSILIEARVSDQSPYDTKILLFHFRDERVRLIEEQLLLPMKRPPVTKLAMGAELKEMVNSALVRRNPMLLAHVDADGQPVVSFRGSVHVISDDQLALWARNAKGRFLSAIAANPKVALMYRDNESRATFQFQGRARVAVGDEERKRVFEALPEVERDHDFGELGTAVIIELDRIEGYAKVEGGGVVGAVNMRRA